ncbi:HK97 family phage prohead protease [Jannaschia sp. R86511]|uniref:HK97 family phage prohead protease n=1 Tax=Jannaschia sp. R86511 TaxID=3093853 RepID=UPI0036D3D8D7
MAARSTATQAAPPAPASTDEGPADNGPRTGVRQVTGLAVPYGENGTGSVGRVRFSAGSVAHSDPALRRIPLLLEHDRSRPVGVVTDLVESPEGLTFTASVDPGADGDLVLAQLASGSRTGVSIGLDLDDKVVEQITRRRGTAAIEASGFLRELSVTSVPAFDSARASTTSPAPAVSGDHAAPAAPSPTAREHLTTAAQEGDMTTFATMTAPAKGKDDTREATPTDGGRPTTDEGGRPVVDETGTATHSAPGQAPRAGRLPGAGGGVARSTFTSYGRGEHSVARDLLASRSGDTDAQARLSAMHEAARTRTAEFAVADRDDFDNSGDASFIKPAYRPELLVAPLPYQRPFLARLSNRTTLSNAQPFVVPTGRPEFTGVGLHTEGTAHVAEGTLSALSTITVTPRAMSGAWRGSRELIEQSTPSIDAIVTAAMQQNYLNATEAYVLATVKAGAGAATPLADAAAVEDAILDRAFARQGMSGFVVVGSAAYRHLAGLTLAGGEPRYPALAPVNRNGVASALDVLSIRGVNIVPVVGLGAWEVLHVEPDAVLVGESAVRTFSFQEVEGPGVIKLALWAYQCAAVLDPSGVELYSLTDPDA